MASGEQPGANWAKASGEQAGPNWAMASGEEAGPNWAMASGEQAGVNWAAMASGKPGANEMTGRVGLAGQKLDVAWLSRMSHQETETQPAPLQKFPRY